MKRIIIFASLLIGMLACSDKEEDDNEQSTVVFTKEQRVLADQIISVFENNTPEIDYAYAENLDDGRGITAGRAGFTSATGDMLTVVERYTHLVPGNPLAVYLPRLRELAAQESDSVDGLENLVDAWQTAAEDEIFREVQDEVVDDEYYWPSVEHAEELGLMYPLSLLNLYDACIQHGDGDDPDGLPAIIDRASEQVGGTPADDIDEHEWLEAFMNIRRSVLLDPADPDTREEWAESVGRVDALIAIFESGNVNLNPPIVISPFDSTFTLPQ
ncbi:MAG: chitosanase [candidate division Zixibacteria bacterium]|nr:chitosanase [candidate division Zixibacteria bacterium]MDD5427445.1 chitosanase [candidate division Zixibacteria bacterium]